MRTHNQVLSLILLTLMGSAAASAQVEKAAARANRAL